MFMIGAAKAVGKRCRRGSLGGHIAKMISKERKRFQKLFRNKEDEGENVIIIVHQTAWLRVVH
jgi:hypothetical protein